MRRVPHTYSEVYKIYTIFIGLYIYIYIHMYILTIYTYAFLLLGVQGFRSLGFGSSRNSLGTLWSSTAPLVLVEVQVKQGCSVLTYIHTYMYIRTCIYIYTHRDEL